MKCLVSEAMWRRIKRVLITEDYSISEYMRFLIREDLKRREAELDCSHFEDFDSAE